MPSRWKPSVFTRTESPSSSQLKVSGEDPEHVLYGVKAIENLMALAARGEPIQEQNVRYVLQLVQEGREEQIHQLAADVICITAKGKNEKECKKLIKPVVKELKARFGRNIFATEESKSLEEAVVDMLKEQEMTLSLAESCTGGAIAARIVNVSGASEVFLQGMVTYSNKAKRRCLDVSKSTLKKHGAVSEECAAEMAKGGRKASKTDICLSVTGIAGPGGGTKEKPVGTVFMGCSYKGCTQVREFHFQGNRARVREQTVAHGLAFLRDCMMERADKENN